MLVANEPEPPSARSSRLAESIRHFSQRLVVLQRPLRLLDAVQWDDQVEHSFFADGARELPRVCRRDYLARPLPFDPDRRQMEFQDLERDVTRVLGNRHGAGRILTRMCREYAGVVRLLAWRGTRTFVELSARLFGTTRGGLVDIHTLSDFAARFPAQAGGGPSHDAATALDELTTRLSGSFDDEPVRVKIVDRLGSDAAAGANYLKLRQGARFSTSEIRLLEVHEGWVHLGTSHNARSQETCAFLRQAPPTSTRTQEGLAVLTEFLAGVSYPDRVRRLSQRVAGIRMAEQGADFLQVFRHLRDTASDERACYRQTARVFRGSLPSGCGPFTKDLSYVQGFTAVVNAVRSNPERAPLLFCGKTAVEDLETLAGLVDDGLLAPPRFLPPPFRNLPDL